MIMATTAFFYLGDTIKTTFILQSIRYGNGRQISVTTIRVSINIRSH